MGRMSDARKRARRGGAAPAPPEPPAEELATPAALEPTGPELAGPPSLAVAEEEVVFSETPVTETALPPPAPLAGRLDLPSSGLAEDILGALERSQDALTISEAPAAPAEVAEAAPHTARGRGLSFFGAPFSESKLISFAYAWEQATHHRKSPRYLSTVELA